MIKLFQLIAVALVAGMIISSAYAAQSGIHTNTRDAAAPFEEILQITASDVTTYDPPLRGCIVEVAGDLVLNLIKGDAAIGVADVTITVLAGQVVPAIIDQVMAATTATVSCGR